MICKAGSGESDDDEDDDDHPLLRRTGDYLTTSEMLPSVNLNIKRLTNLNKEQPTEVSHSRVHSLLVMTSQDQPVPIYYKWYMYPRVPTDIS